VADTPADGQIVGQFDPATPPEMIFEIHVVTGAEAERLQLEQARVLWEVTRWVAQKHSETGQDRAA